MNANRLTFIKVHEIKKKKMSDGYFRNIAYDLYRCICGKEKVIQRRLVRENRTRSCGCLNSELSRKRTIERNKLDAFKNWGNRFDTNKNGKVGKARPNLGKVRCYRDDGTWYFITPERQDAMYHGLEGEVHSLKDLWDPDRTEKWFLIDINTVPERQKPVLELLRKGWKPKEIAKYLELSEHIIYQWTSNWRKDEKVKWSEPEYA